MIGDLIRRVEPVVNRKQSDLLNGLGRLCRCPGVCTGHMPRNPDKAPGT